MDYISDLEQDLPPLQSSPNIKFLFARLKPKTLVNVVTAFDAFFLVIFLVLDILFLFVDSPVNKKVEARVRILLGSHNSDDVAVRVLAGPDLVIGKNTVTHFVMLMIIMVGNLVTLIYTMWFRVKQATSINHGKKKLFFYIRGIWGVLIIILGACIICYDYFGAGGNQWEWGVTIAEIIWGI